MPNWCEGTLKIRGNIKNVERWCKENINVYIHSFKDGNYSMQRDNDNPVKINAGEIDFRFYGFECGNEFNQEVIIENGELKADNKITYDDYFWECPFPNLGG